MLHSRYGPCNLRNADCRIASVADASDFLPTKENEPPYVRPPQAATEDAAAAARRHLLQFQIRRLDVPFELAEALRDQLKAADWEVTWVPFPGGHGIPADVLMAVSKLVPEWLR